MNKEDVAKKLQEAREAMGRNHPQNREYREDLNIKDPALEIKKSLAAEAMRTPEQKEKQALSQKELEKRRIEAQRAMQTPEQKEVREKEEREKREQELAKAKLAELREEKRKRDLLKQKQTEAEKQTVENKKISNQEKYLKTLEQTNEAIRNITEKSETEVPTYHTLKTDTANTVKDDSLTMADIALKQQKVQSNPPTPKKTNKILTLSLGLIMIISGLGLVYGAWIIVNNNRPGSLEPIPPIVSAERAIEIPINEETKSKFLEIINTTQLPNTISYLYFTKTDEDIYRVASLEEFWQAIEVSLPPEFTHFLTDRYMFGLYHSEPVSPFVILTTNSFTNTFDSLLRQEREIIEQILSVYKPTNLTGGFSDRLIQNLDIRVSLNSEGEIVALYTFLDPNTLLITNNIESLNRIMSLTRISP